jgi:hypothetical protein
MLIYILHEPLEVRVIFPVSVDQNDLDDVRKLLFIHLIHELFLLLLQHKILL